MSEQHTLTPSIESQALCTEQARLQSAEFRAMVGELGLGGATPEERVLQLGTRSVEQVGAFLTEVNRRLNASETALISNSVVPVGDVPTLQPTERPKLLEYFLGKVREGSSGINPERIGDAFALTVVLAHAFQDANGRTARAVGSLFRDNFDQPDYPDVFAGVTVSRDELRAQGGSVVNGYIPHQEAGMEPGSLEGGKALIDLMFTSEPAPYAGPYGGAHLTEKGTMVISRRLARMMGQLTQESAPQS
ncbi:MAG TPA: Fic family protein [Candidatus Saccharibacteria bacterium]|nr:Fic family protein [Candidatus Saccharibacteria bacterium]